MSKPIGHTEYCNNPKCRGNCRNPVIDIDKFIGNLTNEKCPKCGSLLLSSKSGETWCENPSCDYGCEEFYKELGL